MRHRAAAGQEGGTPCWVSFPEPGCGGLCGDRPLPIRGHLTNCLPVSPVCEGPEFVHAAPTHRTVNSIRDTWELLSQLAALVWSVLVAGDRLPPEMVGRRGLRGTETWVESCPFCTLYGPGWSPRPRLRAAMSETGMVTMPTWRGGVSSAPPAVSPGHRASVVFGDGSVRGHLILFSWGHSACLSQACHSEEEKTP